MPLREKIAAEKHEREARYERFARLWDEAVTAGDRAAEECIPSPMVVSGQTYSEGVCGFAEICIRGGTSFAHWAKKNVGFRKRYGGGLSFWVSAYGQSYERKRAFASAVCRTLNEAGIKAYPASRLD